MTVTEVELDVSEAPLSSSSKGEFSKWKNVEKLFSPARTKQVKLTVVIVR
jgi:hypothetical protein